LLALVDELRAAGVREVRAAFNGYGDEGAIESIEFLNAQGEPLDVKQFPDPAASFTALLPDGYDQNEGSSGTVCLDVEQGRVVVDVNWNVIASENQNYEV
jgi:hypothetical protein